MATNSGYKYNACDVVLNRRWRSDTDRTAEMLRRYAGHDPAVLAAAEFWIAWAIADLEEHGAEAVARVRDRHAYAGAWR
jgi:hypothetical protein